MEQIDAGGEPIPIEMRRRATGEFARRERDKRASIALKILACTRIKCQLNCFQSRNPPVWLSEPSFHTQGLLGDEKGASLKNESRALSVNRRTKMRTSRFGAASTETNAGITGQPPRGNYILDAVHGSKPRVSFVTGAGGVGGAAQGTFVKSKNSIKFG